MAQAVPLGATLRVEMKNVVMRNDLILAAAVSFLEIDNDLLEAFSACNTIAEMV